MSILDEYPGPWKMNDFGELSDAKDEHMVTVRFPSCIEAEDLERLILAAPELLAALKEYDERVSADCIRGLDGYEFTGRVSALIARIEGGK